MQVVPVPCLKDNYAYLVWKEKSDGALVVDPGEALPVMKRATELGLKIRAILATHHHADHVGGNAELVRAEPLPIYGHASERQRIPHLSVLLEHEQEFELLGLRFRALHVPGHTRGAVAFVGGGAAFTGDTLFAAGCGRLFEGTPEEMYASLNVKLGALPDATAIYCGHEYTASNLRFAAHVEPSNQAVTQKAARVAEARSRGQPTVPSTLADERATNPFLRCDAPEVRAHVAHTIEVGAHPARVLWALRAEKDKF